MKRIYSLFVLIILMSGCVYEGYRSLYGDNWMAEHLPKNDTSDQSSDTSGQTHAKPVDDQTGDENVNTSTTTIGTTTTSTTTATTIGTTTTTIQYTITFNANGGNGTMADITMINGESKTLPLCSFVPPVGKKFSCWLALDNNYATYLGDGAVIKDLMSENGAAVTLSAQWVANTYTVIYYGNGGVGVMPRQDMIFGTPTALIKCNYQNGDNVFLGWLNNLDHKVYGDEDLVSEMTADKSGIAELYALWGKSEWNSDGDINALLTLNDDGNITANITDTNPDLHKVKDFCQNFACKVRLDLSDCSELDTFSDMKNCTNLVDIKIPDNVTTISAGAFNGCSSLESMTIPFVGASAAVPTANSLKLFGYIFGSNGYEGGTVINQIYPTVSMYGMCYDSKNYIIPAMLKSVIINSGSNIQDYAFYNCSNLTSIKIPDTVTRIGDDAFYCCTELTSITIPNSVTSIEKYAFSQCEKLTNVSMSDNLTSIDQYAFDHCTNLTSINIPDSVTSIGQRAFCATGLTSIKIPDGMTIIQRYTFNACLSLTSVIIPASVKSIGEGAFHSSYKIASVTVYATKPPSFGDEAFYSNIVGGYTGKIQCKFYVPAASVEAYKSADGWSEYASQIYAIEE